ncbi:MarR family transcriptional regulator [Rhodobacteraceae bacterium LMO-12]|nr:MarR family transcriptional regulator [Rhodobacteraceae bacterium LMO-JJ12]
MSEIHDMAGHLIRRLNQISMAVFAERMAEIDAEITPVQYAALTTILENPGVGQSKLAGAIAYDKATIGGVVDRLEAKGLIMRKQSKTDGRARALAITSDGKALLERIKPVVRALQDDILNGLDQSEKSQMMALLSKTTAAGNARSRAPLQPQGKARASMQ